MKKVLALILTGVMLLSMAACGVVEDFDAKGYVQASLDAKYQRVYEDYAEMIGSTVEEAKKQMEDEFNASLKEQITLTGLTATEEEIKEYQAMEADVRKMVTYEVKDAVKDDDDNFTVEVVVTPFLAYAGLNDTFTADLTAAVQGGAAEDAYMGVFLGSLSKCIDAAQTGEEVTYTFHVTWKEKDGKKLYTISEDELMEFDLVATGQQAAE